MRTDCHVCRSEGLIPQSRVLLRNSKHETIATLHQVESDLLDVDEAGLSEIAWQRLAVSEGDPIYASHPKPVASLSFVRGRIYGHRLDEAPLRAIISDVVNGSYSDVDLSAFITACAASPLDKDETIALTKAMVDVGEKLTWDHRPVVDKHSVGGLPGNRTTPLVVSIVAAHGLTMPKTSSRAITSPAGTADTMETMAPVDLDLPAIRRVIDKESGCIVWGGAVRLSPADDILIRIERALDIDSEGQLVASVLSKKIAAGSSHLVLDIPVGPTAKVRTLEAASQLSKRLGEVAAAFGVQATIVVSDGNQPVGSGIGPALAGNVPVAVEVGREALPTMSR
jgi:thymidine phosphorylase